MVKQMAEEMMIVFLLFFMIFLSFPDNGFNEYWQYPKKKSNKKSHRVGGLAVI